MLAPNTILQNRYRVIQELGHGGMGTVYEALDQRVNCLVALKETLVTRDGEARKAFEREAALLANLRHQALPKVMDYFSENEGYFLVMEFIAGHDLAKVLASRGSPFPQSQVLGWADDLLKLLEYLHGRQQPILHRDIKPANLKVTDRGEIFLLDFGLAKGSTGQMPTLVTSRSVFGYTPSYASLEQILGQGTDPRSDLYSLGATLYHLLAGAPPTDGPTRFNAIEDEKPDPLYPIEKVNPQASSGVTAVIHQAMAMIRKQRPDSAAEMRKALRNAAEEDERRASEEDARAEAMRRRKRNLIIGAVLLVVFAGVAFFIWSHSGKTTGLVWSDEFNGPDGSPIDQSKWTAEVGGLGWGNNELQYYTTNNAYQSAGSLVIKTIKEKYTGSDNVTRDYTSARLHTKNKFTATYGRFEARIKLPYGQGIWPTFWLLGSNIDSVGWPQCGEVNIMENTGKEPSAIYGTIHGPGYSGANGISASYSPSRGLRLADSFHTFAVEWEPNVISFYCDGILYKTITPADLPQGQTWVFDHPFFILLNVAVGGNWPGSPDGTTVFPQTMQVDYVRVYQRSSP